MIGGDSGAGDGWLAALSVVIVRMPSARVAATGVKRLASSKKEIIILPVMARTLCTLSGMVCKALCAVMLLAACTVNPATGQRQFAALMPPEQESRIGAQQHEKVLKEFGALRPDDPVQIYVNQVGRRVAADTERADVAYKFFVLDTPTVNAFALPGGYVYVTRGILAEANSEAELAGVLAHEIGHITARHSAERYSHGILTALGAAVVAAAADSAQAAQIAGVSSDLYIKSYSRSQESEADALGIRYLHKAGYDVGAMARFLENLGAQDDLEGRMAGNGGAPAFSYFSTHPRTEDRVAQAYEIGATYPKNQMDVGIERYFAAIDGIVYGDSEKQGFVRGQNFFHPAMCFTFGVPSGFRIDNQPAQVVAAARNGAVMIFDGVSSGGLADPATYISRIWMRGQLPGAPPERIEINGKEAAAASFPGRVGGRPVTIRLVAVAWAPDKFFRFQIAIPDGAEPGFLDEVKRAVGSLRPMTAQEKRDIRPWSLHIVTAKAGDTVSSLATQTPFHDFSAERFRVLNGMREGAEIVARRQYKIVEDQ